MPWPEGGATLTKCSPLPEGVTAIPAEGLAPVKELTWDIPTLSRGEQKLYELEFTPAPTSKKVSAKAYISFEYGAVVETNIDKPSVVVTKTATPKVAIGQLATVRVEIKNTGTVPVPQLRLVENNPPDAEYRGVEDSKKTNITGQREWKFKQLAPGQSIFVTYQLLHRKGGEYPSKSSVDCELGTLDSASADATTVVQIPTLDLTFEGQANAEAKASAQYTATVKNTGSMDLTDVRVQVSVPKELYISKLTNGAERRQGVVGWLIPKLPAGEGKAFNIVVTPEPGVAGKKILYAAAREGRGLVDVIKKEATTEFAGKADLRWKPSFDQVQIDLNRQGTITVQVKNDGSTADRGVRLRIMVPDKVRVLLDDQDQDTAQLKGNEVVFPLVDLIPGKSREFRLKYLGIKEGLADFRIMLESQSLGDAPLNKTQTITIGR